MKFSVLMSLYIKERPQFLTECFESLQAQTRQADEIILVLDGNITEELELVIAKFSQILPLVVVRFSQNRGLAIALNEGLKHCQHDWVFRMDTDDVCHPERFEKQLAYIEKNPEVVIFGGQIAEFNQHIGEVVSHRRVPTSMEDILKFTQLRCPFNHMTVAYQKEYAQKAGGYEGLQEDYKLWIKMIALGKPVANLPDLLVYARIGNGMVGRRRGLAYAKSEWELYQLKRKYHLQGMWSGLVTFVLRALPRVLPVFLLQKLYVLTRK